MEKMLELKAETRDVTGRHVKKLRQQGWIPAIVYGHGLESQKIQIAAKPLSKILGQAGTNRLISLQIGDKEPVTILARDIQRDVIRRDYLHVDFYAVKMDEKVHAHIPVILVGDAPATREEGGILTQGIDSLEVECLPMDLISQIEVDVTVLANINDVITVSELNIPDSITVLADPTSMIAKVEPPRMLEEELEEEEEALEPLVEPEVITEGEEEEVEEVEE